jgi:hypothetical protein
MTTLAEGWTKAHDSAIPKFQPCARYIAPMDCLIYLREDCSYRAVRLNAYQTVLLHPYEDRPVGVKLKGMRFLHTRLRAILKAAKVADANLEGFALIAFWELALTASGDDETSDAEAARRQQLGARARSEIIEKASRLSVEDLPQAA